MKKYMVILATMVIMLLPVTCWVTAEESGNNPVAVSPGTDKEIVTVWQSCPTFSWSSVDQAVSYRIAVFESLDGKIAPYEGMAARSAPVISKQIPGPALSWTLSSEESLKTGGIYAWYVQAVDASGNTFGEWSDGKVFRVEQELRFAGIEEKLAEKLREYGVNEETITNVLSDMKSGVKEVVVHGTGGAGSKNTPDLSGVQGIETSTKTLYGLGAGSSITSGNANTFIGYWAGYFNTSGSYNTFLGHFAGCFNFSGYRNTFLGCGAGYNNISANDNTFTGNEAGCANTSGYSNTFLGSNAGRFNNSGDYNTFLGGYAGRYNTTGTRNTFLGCRSGYANTTAHNNTFLGYYSGRSNTTGSNNIFLGNYAGYSNTTGDENTFLGYYTGYYNTTGNSNTFLGDYAGRHNNTGNNNTIIGYCAGFYNATGNDNTFIGYLAGVNNTGYYNTFIGFGAGQANTTGGKNVFLGYKAGFNETGSHKLCIANSNTPTPLIYGEFDNNIVKINGRLGIGVNPTHLIHLAGGAYSDGCTWTDCSSRALKENIEKLSTAEAVDVLIRLNPVKYNYKIDKTDKHVGFIAEDVPDLVASADRKGLSSMDITAVLTKVVQELRRENQEYKKIISDLQERLAKLEKK